MIKVVHSITFSTKNNNYSKYTYCYSFLHFINFHEIESQFKFSWKLFMEIPQIELFFNLLTFSLLKFSLKLTQTFFLKNALK